MTTATTIDDYFSYDYACYSDPTFSDLAALKGVRFNECVSFVNRGYISEEDMDLMWYSEDEYESITNSNVTDLRNCTLARGLEGYHLDACDIKNEVQRRHIKNILVLQKDHVKARLKDPNGLKTLSLALSKEAVKEARQRAERDAIDAFLSNQNSPYLKAATAKEYAKKTVWRRPLSRSKTS